MTYRQGQFRALHVAPSMSSEWGGPVVVVSELTSALQAEGIRCEIATTRERRVGYCPVSPRGVPTHVFDTGLPARIWTSYSKPLTEFLDENINRFDLVHVHEIWHYAGYAAFRAAKKNGIPYVLTIHGELSEWRLRHKGWKKSLYRRAILDKMLREADSLHAITTNEKERIGSLGYQTPVTIVPNGIDATQFDDLPSSTEFLNRFPVLNGKCVILFLSRLNPTKGLDILARSLAEIARRVPDAALLAVGPDEEGGQQVMESILHSKGVRDRAVFTGMLTGADKLAAMSCADVFVLPSYSEGFSIAILEAMAARLPVVITTGCNFPEVAEHGAGFVVDANDLAVTNAIERLLSNSDMRLQMGERGRELVTKRYTWQTAAATIANLYRALAAKRKREAGI